MYFNDDNIFFKLDNNNYIDFNFNNFDFNRNEKFLLLEDGFNKGNLFNNLYSKYKNHVYKLKVNNDKDKLLYMIQIYNFAINDLALYLDIYPNDKEKLKEFIDYKNKYLELNDEYNSKYSPLCITDISNSNRWTWTDNPWPWDNNTQKSNYDKRWDGGYINV